MDALEVLLAVRKANQETTRWKMNFGCAVVIAVVLYGCLFVSFKGWSELCP